MPSYVHEALSLLFRNRPELAPELLRDALHVQLPPYTEARIDSADLTEIQPAEYRADLVVLLLNGTPVLGIVVEVQLSRDDRKQFVWLLTVRFGPLTEEIQDRITATSADELEWHRRTSADRADAAGNAGDNLSDALFTGCTL